MTIVLATWIQQADLASTQHWIVILMAILAISILLLAIVGSVVLVGLLKEVKTATGVVSDLRDKANPVIQDMTAISRQMRELLEDSKPKIKTITENIASASATLSETAMIAKSAVQKVEVTLSDANARTQRQVARVDGMVSAALNTTAEVVEAVNHGIRAPAQKIAQAAGQAKIIAEGLLDRIKGMAGSIPFVGQRPAGRSVSNSSSATYRPAHQSTPPGSGTGAGAAASAAGTMSSTESAGRTYAAAPKEY